MSLRTAANRRGVPFSRYRGSGSLKSRIIDNSNFDSHCLNGCSGVESFAVAQPLVFAPPNAVQSALPRSFRSLDLLAKSFQFFLQLPDELRNTVTICILQTKHRLPPFDVYDAVTVMNDSLPKKESLNAYRQPRIFSAAIKLQPDQHEGYVRAANALRKCASFCERKGFFARMGRVMRDAVDAGIGNDFAYSENIVHSRFVLQTQHSEMG